MSPQTEMARRMTAVVADVKDEFRNRGFRKRRNIVNRETEPGLVHVVQFRMARYEGYGEPHDPFDEWGYGRFSIDVGIWVEEMHRALFSDKRPQFVEESLCEVRTTVSELVPGTPATWYLGEDHATLVAEAQRVLAGVFAYFDRLATRDDLLAEVAAGRVRLTRGRLAEATVHLARGDRPRAELLIREHLAGDHHPSHPAWVRDVVAPRLGLRL